MVGGDCFGVPAENGSVDFLESQFCRSATWGKNKNIVHGIEMLPGSRRRENYYFTDEPISPWSTIKMSQVTPTPAYYFDELTQKDERNVFHVKLLGRFKQTRGITAFAPMFTPADYLDDIEYLEMVHKRAASLFAFIRTRAPSFDPKYLAAEQALGPDVTSEKTRDEVEAANRQFREVAPGTVLSGLPGETISMGSPNIPNPEHFQQVEMLLTYIGINIGMPLIAVLMDGRQTNFSGWRGAWNMALSGFRRNQRRLITRFHCPYLRFKLLKYAEQDAAIARWVAKSLKPNAKVNIFSHWWQPPSWPYIQPVEDATADMIRDVGRQTSPRRRMQERGMEWNEVWPEIIEDWSDPIIAAKEKAKQINDKYPDDLDKVSWRDIFQPPLPERVNVQIREDINQQQVNQPKQPATKPAK
jgi:capsid protein